MKGNQIWLIHRPHQMLRKFAKRSKALRSVESKCFAFSSVVYECTGNMIVEFWNHFGGQRLGCLYIPIFTL